MSRVWINKAAVAREERIEAHQRNIVHLLMRYDSMDILSIAQQLRLTVSDTERAVDILLRMQPSPLARSGRFNTYQLSPTGRQVFNVRIPQAPVVPSAQTTSTAIDPGPRGKLIAALKQRPCSLKELIERTRLSGSQIYLYLKTLKERGIVREDRAKEDGRILLYRLTTIQYDEPDKPLLTPALVPLEDKDDWRTWAERLLIEQAGGAAAIQVPKIEKQSTIGQPKIILPRVLIVGAMPTVWREEVQREFGTQLRLDFFDDMGGSAGILERCRKSQHVFLRILQARHTHQAVIRTSGVAMTMVRGNLTQLRTALRDFCKTL